MISSTLKKMKNRLYFLFFIEQFWAFRTSFFRRTRSMRGQAAFTFLELIFVIAIIALVYSFAAPQVGNRGGTEITIKLGELAGDFRNAYDLAVLNRKPHRLVFDLASGNYQLQFTERTDFKLGDEKLDRDLTAEEEKDALEEFNSDFEEYIDLAGEEVQHPEEDKIIAPSSPVLKAKDRLKPVEWTPVTVRKWRKKTIGPLLTIQDLQAEHHGEKQTFAELEEEARGIVYFFPSGYVEKAVIHIAVRGDDQLSIDETQPPYTLTTNPYEGTAEVESGYEEYEIHGDYKSAAGLR